MSRPKRIRKVNNPPHFKGFRPIGLPGEDRAVVMNYEEYEAIRLSDFELMGQFQAAEAMGVSRPTYARIYESARRKIAQAFIEGVALVFEGGKVYFDSEWYRCQSCGCWFNHPAKDQEIENCALCGSTDIEQYQDNGGKGQTEDQCICPKCGTEKMHVVGIPCQEEICPNCNSQMIRKWTPHHHRRGNINCKYK